MSKSGAPAAVAVGRLRAELMAVLADLDRWEDFRHVEMGRAYVERVRRVRRVMAGITGEMPAEFWFTGDDLSRTGQTVREPAAQRLRTHIESLLASLPGSPLPWEAENAGAAGKVATPWPLSRIRQELRELSTELARWQSYRHVDLAEQFRQRANLVLAHVRGQPATGRRLMPAPLQFTEPDVTAGRTLTEHAYQRLVGFVDELTQLVPAGAGLSATRSDLADLHPLVATAASTGWQRNDHTSAVLAAIETFCDRLRQRTGLVEPAPIELLDLALGTGSPSLLLADVTTEAGRREQSGWHHMALGLVLGIGASARPRPPADLPAGRAREMLAVVSLLLHRVDMAAARSAPAQ